jgi:hypothetical protein
MEFMQNILFIPGINIAQITSIEERFEKDFADIIGINDFYNVELENEILVYDKIPSVYNSKTWPDKTNLKCWNCDIHFESKPIFIPLDIPYNFESDETLNISVDIDKGGNFCSANCAYTFILTQYPVQQKHTKIYMLKILLRDMFPESVFNFVEIPSRHSRVEYGGKLSIEQYKKMNNK